MADPISSTRLLQAYERATIDPASQQQVIIEELEAVLDGTELIVDPSNPYWFLMEAAITTAAYASQRNQALARKQYPSLAMTEEDLYMHMTDRDFLDRFAQPGGVPMSFMFSIDEIRSLAVDTGINGAKKLTMGKHSNFTVAGRTFTLDYPVEFRVSSSGGIAVGFGTPKHRPLHSISDSNIQWQPATVDGVDVLFMVLPMYQYKIDSNVAQLDAATVYAETFTFTDKFYYCRVFSRNPATGEWDQEIRTTHTDQVFDPTKPTALLKVVGDKLTVRIPQVYLTHQLIGGEIRIDIYTTKAENNLDMRGYEPNAYLPRWVDLDNEDNLRYSAPMALLSTWNIFSNGVTAGAREALTFAQLRNRVMDHNVGEIVVPITDVNSKRKLENVGYGSVTETDLITKRDIWGTRALPVPVDGYTVTPANCGIATLSFRMSELNGQPGVHDNGERITLNPSVLYRNDTGAPTIVPQYEIDSLRQMVPDGMARLISSRNYIYSPFHYVLDASGSNFDLRPYYLDDPETGVREFIADNGSTGIELYSAQNVSLVYSDSGYKLIVVVRSGQTYKDLRDDQLALQLAYTPPNEVSMAYLNGSLVGVDNESGERVWEFDIGSNFDVTAQDHLMLTTFSMYSDEPRVHPVELSTTFDLIYVVHDYELEGMVNSSIDLVKNSALLPVGSIGLLQERVSLTFGSALTYLWRGSRTIPTGMDILRYTGDVLKFWETDVPDRNPDKSMKFEVIDDKLVPILLHRRGDPVLDENGEQEYAARAGDPILDANGNVQIIGPRGLARQVDMLFLDGRYWFANDASDEAYKTFLRQQIKTWSTEHLGALNEQALELTNIYFRPSTRMGGVRVVVEEGREITIDAEQSFSVVIYLSQSGYNNDSLKQSLTRQVISTLAASLEESTVAIDEQQTSIRELASTEIIGVEVSGLGGEEDFQLVTLQDDSGRLSIRKRLVALPDGGFTVEDDVDVIYRRHVINRQA